MVNLITKSDFLLYLICNSSFWLKKNKKAVYKEEEISEFEQIIIDSGIEIEEYGNKLFEDAIFIEETNENSDAVKKTAEALKEEKTIIQASFQTPELFARIDVLEKNKDGTFNLIEIKASGELKKTGARNHIDDLCFQKYVLEENNIKIKSCFVLHPSSEYFLKGELDIKKLFKKENVDEYILKKFEENKIYINNAIKLAKEKEINKKECPCSKKTKANHCSNFEYFNKAIPKGSVWYLAGIRANKLNYFLSKNIIYIKDITPDDFENINDRQVRQVKAERLENPYINEVELKKLLEKMEEPLYFLDYESVMFVIPKIQNTKPWQHIVFQYSLHKIENGKMSHFEYIMDSLEDELGLLKSLKQNIGDKGSVVVWNKSYECSRNRELIKRYPKEANFLTNVNDRVFDLKDVFKDYYEDVEFNGSHSIKSVLPVLCSEFSYKELEISNGTDAVRGYLKFLENDTTKEEKEKIKKDLFAYCNLDTLAMVEIYKKIKEI